MNALSSTATRMKIPLLSVLAVLLGQGQLLPAQAEASDQLVGRVAATGPALGEFGRLAVSYRGIVAVVSPQELTIRLFDSTGAPMGVLGRRGEAPGEFRRLHGASLGWIGDTLWVFERAVGRLTYFQATGEVLRVDSEAGMILPPQGRPLEKSQGRSSSIEAFATGGATVRGLAISGSLPPPGWLSLPARLDQNAGAFLLLAASPDRYYRRTLAIIPEPIECQRRFGQLLVVTVPLCARVSHGVSPDGQRVAIISATGRDSYRVEVTEVQGEGPPILIQQRVTPVRADQPAKDSVRKSLTAGQTLPVDVQRWIDELPIPDWYPPVERVLLGADGTIWAKEYQDRGLPQRWRVFNAWGRELRSVTLPGGVDVRWARLDSIWAVQEDADGAEELVRYAVR